MLAYIDGTTGGMMLQVLLGSLVGGIVILKLAARSLFGALLRRKRDDQQPESEAPASRDESPVA